MTCMEPFPCFAVNFPHNFPSTTGEEMVTEVVGFFWSNVKKIFLCNHAWIKHHPRRWSKVFSHRAKLRSPLCLHQFHFTLALRAPAAEVRAAQVGEVKYLLLLCFHPISLTTLMLAFCGGLQKAQLTAVRRTIWRDSVKSLSLNTALNL